LFRIFAVGICSSILLCLVRYLLSIIVFSMSTKQPSTQAPITGKSDVAITWRSDILDGAITPTLWSFTLPLTFSFMVNIAYSWIDTYFVSHLGPAAIAAIGFCEQINFAIFNVASGFVVGTGIIIARRIGEGNKAEAERVAAQSVVVMLGFALVVMAAFYLGLPWILPAFGLEGERLVYATQYMQMVLLGIPGIFFIFLLNVIMRSAGNSAFSMRTLLLSTIMNALLAPVLVFGWGPIPTLGMAGAGLATALAQLSGGAWGLYEAFSGKNVVTLPRPLPKPEWSVVRSIIALGVPSSLQFIAISVARISMMSLANHFGIAVAAAYTLGLKVDLFVYMPIFAVGVAIESITGQNLGAKQIDRVFAFYKAALWQVVAITTVLGISAYFFGDTFVQMFTTDRSIIGLSAEYLRTMAFAYPVFAALVLSVRILSGAGDAIRAMMILGGLSLFLQVPLVYGLSRWTVFSYAGLWVGVVVAYCIMAAVALQAVYGRKWLTVKV
jgi:putative MATE family efflux protein